MSLRKICGFKKAENMKFFIRIVSACSLLLIGGCHLAHSPSAVSGTHSIHTPNANTLEIREAHPLKGSKKVTVHAYAYTRGSDSCSRTVAINFSSTLTYTQTLIALRNRALVTGANTLSITGWNEQAGHTTLTAHFFDCHSKRGL